jgi:regulator of nucleoside diphosphate kinase
MNSHVTYIEEPGGARHNVTLVHPRRANPAEGRISVLSPIGRALLGRRPGAVVAAANNPAVRPLRLRVLSSERVAS